MIQYQNFVRNLRRRFKSWLEENHSSISSVTGIGVTAWAIGALLGQLSVEAQATSWTLVIATLSAELGKDFVVGLIEQIRERALGTEEISKVVQHELDSRRNMPDLWKLLEAVELLPTTLDVILEQKNMQLLTALQSDLSTYPQILSGQAAEQFKAVISSELEQLTKRIDALDTMGKKTLQILTMFAAVPTIALKTGDEPPFLVYICSPLDRLNEERQILRSTITALGITRPWQFDLTASVAQPDHNSYLEKIQQSDFFILLIDEDISPAMQSEFDAAVASKKTILAFLKKDRKGKDKIRDAASLLLIQQIPIRSFSFSNLTDLAFQAQMIICDEIIRRVRNQSIILSDENFRVVEKTSTRLLRATLNLPPRPYTQLLGRSDDLASLRDKLFSDNGNDHSIIAITGLGGIGKTALAYEVAEKAILDGYFDGLVWESAKSEELGANEIISIDSQLLTAESLLHSIALQIGDESLGLTPPKELEKRVKSLLFEHPYLVVVDNLETVEAYEQLAKFLHHLLSPSHAKPNSRAIVTCRERLFDIPYIYDRYIRGLSPSDSFSFITQEALSRGDSNLSAMPSDFKERIVQVTDGMPLAMKLMVSQFIAGIPLDTELERLRSAKENNLYEYIYLSLWQRLSIPAKKVLVAAASFSSSVTRSMLQPVSRVTSSDLEVAVVELVRLSLIEASDDLMASDRRYSMHPLTRWFINSPLRNQWQRNKKL